MKSVRFIGVALIAASGAWMGVAQAADEGKVVVAQAAAQRAPVVVAQAGAAGASDHLALHLEERTAAHGRRLARSSAHGQVLDAPLATVLSARAPPADTNRRSMRPRRLLPALWLLLLAGAACGRKGDLQSLGVHVFPGSTPVASENASDSSDRRTWEFTTERSFEEVVDWYRRRYRHCMLTIVKTAMVAKYVPLAVDSRATSCARGRSLSSPGRPSRRIGSARSSHRRRR